MAHYYRNKSQIGLVIDQCNTHRFFSSLWIPHNKRVFFIHQLTREIWQQIFPGVKGQVGNFMETVMLKMNRNDNTITVSEFQDRVRLERALLNLQINNFVANLSASGLDPNQFAGQEPLRTWLSQVQIPDQLGNSVVNTMVDNLLVRQQAEACQRGDGFSGPAFADKRDGLAGGDVEGQVPDRARLDAVTAEGDGQVPKREKRRAHEKVFRGSKASRTPSKMKTRRARSNAKTRNAVMPSQGA